MDLHLDFWPKIPSLKIRSDRRLDHEVLQFWRKFTWDPPWKVRTTPADLVRVTPLYEICGENIIEGGHLIFFGGWGDSMPSDPLSTCQYLIVTKLSNLFNSQNYVIQANAINHWCWWYSMWKSAFIWKWSQRKSIPHYMLYAAKTKFH